MASARNTRHAWQSRPSLEPKAHAVETGPVFREAVEQFLSSAETLIGVTLCRNDLIEFVAQSAGGSVDRRLPAACQAHKAGQLAERDRMAVEALGMLNRIDGLLNLRPDRRLESWVADTRRWEATSDGTNRETSTDISKETWLSSLWRPTPPAPVKDLVAECRAMLEVCSGWN